MVLAAGFSSRAGTFKMTCELAGKTVIERCIDGMYDLCDRVIVVGGYRIGALSFLINRYRRLKIIYNEDYVSGMFSSVRCGLLDASAGRVFVTPGDYPLIGPLVYKAMLDTDGEIVLPSYLGCTGHPALLARSAVERLLYGDWDNLHAFIEDTAYTTVAVNEPGILIDLDTPEDFQRIASGGAAWST